MQRSLPRVIGGSPWGSLNLSAPARSAEASFGSPRPSVGLACRPRGRVSSRSGSARLVAPRKMACPLARGAFHWTGFKAINSRTGEGQPGRCPFKSRATLTARPAILFCSPPSRALALAMDHTNDLRAAHHALSGSYREVGRMRGSIQV